MKLKAVVVSVFLLFNFMVWQNINAQTYVSGTIAENTTWTLAGSPYIVTGNITVNNGVTLTIEPGVEVKFDGVYSFNIYGSIVADGTSSNKIIFTSNNATPSPGDWYRLNLKPNLGAIPKS